MLLGDLGKSVLCFHIFQSLHHNSLHMVLLTTYMLLDISTSVLLRAVIINPRTLFLQYSGFELDERGSYLSKRAKDLGRIQCRREYTLGCSFKFSFYCFHQPPASSSQPLSSTDMINSTALFARPICKTLINCAGI